MAVALIDRLGQPGGFTYVTNQSSEFVETMRALRWPSLAASLSCLIGCLGDPVGPAGTLVVRRLAPLDSVLVGAPGRPLPTAITFRVLDGAGRPLPAAAVSWTIAGTNARVDGAPANTDARGEVSAVWVLGTRAAEAQSLTLQAAVERHTATVTVPAVAKPIEVSSVAFSTRDTTVVKLGVATALGVEATDPFGNKFVPAGVRYVSLDTSLCVVDSLGSVSARKRGFGRIVAMAGSAADTAWVHPTQIVQKIVATPDTLRFHSLGQTATLAVQLLDDQGLPVRDSLAADSVAVDTVVKVQAGSTYTIRSLANGRTPLILRAGPVAQTVQVLVHQRVASVKLSASRASLDALGDTVQLTTIAFDSLGTQLANQMLGYSAGDTSVVTVGASGLVTSKGNGATWIHATARNGAADSVRVVVAQQVARVVVPRDSILFEAVQAALPIRATPLDRFGSPVTAAVLTYSTQGPSIATVDTTGTIRALANGNTVVTASYGTDSVLVFVRVAQRPVRVDVSGDTVRFSALGDVQTIAAVAVDSLGSPVPHAVIGLRVPDTAVVTRVDSLRVRSTGNGTTTLRLTIAGVEASAVASVRQVATRIVASLKTPDSVVNLPLSTMIPVACEARDRNDYVVPGPPSVEPSNGARWIGTRCDSLRVLRSGLDTLRLTAGTARASLGVLLVVRPPEQLSAVPAIARVTAGPDETFVSWVQQDAGFDAAAVWVRSLGTPSWDQKDVLRSRSWLAVPGGYAAGTQVEVALAFTDVRGSTQGAQVDTVTVRNGDTCRNYAGYASTDLRVFCTGSDLLTWISTQGLDPQSVRCGNETLLTLRDSLPNCVYQVGSEHLVLLRGLDEAFRPGSALARPQLSNAYNQVLFGHSTAQATLWQDDPAIGTPLTVARVGLVTGYQSAISWRTEVNSVGVITWFEPPNPNGAIAIYHEGHGGDFSEIGAETISWLLQRGWSVVGLNLPRVPHMYLRDLHSGEENPLWRMLYGIAQVTQWIHRSWAPGRDPVVVAIGRSGGGWASLLYAALDQRIDATAVVSGFVPVSQRLKDNGLNVGDWEQIDPSTFGVLDYTDMVRLADTRDLLLTYSEGDECCFRVSPDDPFAQWLSAEVVEAPAKLTTVISPAQEHGLSPEGYAALADLLDRALARGH